MEPDMIAGALIALGAFLAGQWLPRPHRRRGQPKPPKPVAPVCGCSHHYSYHDPKTGECHGTVAVPVKWSQYGDERAWRNEPCGCRVYTGPQPLPEFYAQEISSG
jgi:hypothetical protein